MHLEFQETEQIEAVKGQRLMHSHLPISLLPVSRSTRREPSTMGKQLVDFITCGCESSAPFFCNLQSRA
jgi:hypothetical protein